VFDLSHFYAIVADFRTRVQYLFSKPRYSILMGSHLSRLSSAGNTTAYQAICETVDRKASIRTCKSSPFVRMKSDSFAKSMKRLERVKSSVSKN
jgi:hypothetical protein